MPGGLLAKAQAFTCPQGGDDFAGFANGGSGGISALPDQMEPLDR
jgi:hypothetical protein